MNAPVKIQIDDKVQRKADLWDAAQDGELSLHDARLIDDALAHYAEHMQREAGRLKSLYQQFAALPKNNSIYPQNRVDGFYIAYCETLGLADRTKELRDKFQNGGNAYIMPGDA